MTITVNMKIAMAVNDPDQENEAEDILLQLKPYSWQGVLQRCQLQLKYQNRARAMVYKT